MAVIKEDVIKLTFKFDDREAVQAEVAASDIADAMKKVSAGTDKAEDGFEDAAKAADKFGKTNLSKLSDGIDKIVDGVGKFALKMGIATAKTVAAGAAAATAGIVALGSAAVKSYAEYEQLIGGVDTLFGEAAGTMLKNANEAYKTAGLSANNYMSTVTSFSASLINSLGGDTVKAAEMADQAIIDMADNANKMGTDMTMIQNAYQGFAKQNYTMLDNLKLGYGGTQEEMKRLLKDAEKLTGKKYDISNFADVTEAIHAIQVEMGIAGTTAKEASETIQGSALAMKSAWHNFVTGMADDNADFDQLLDNLLDSVRTFLGNIIPRIKKMLPRLVQGLVEIAKAIGKDLPGILNELLPALVEGAADLLGSMWDVLKANAGTLKTIGMGIIKAIYEGFTGEEMPEDMFNTIKGKIDEVVEAAKKILSGLVNFGTQLMQVLGPALVWIADVAAKAFCWVGDNIDWLLPILGSLLGAMLAFKAVKGVTGVVQGFMGLFSKGGALGGGSGAGGSTGGGLGNALNFKSVGSAMGGIATAIGGIAAIVAAFAALKQIPGYDEFMADGGAALKQLCGIIADIGLVGGAFVAFVSVAGKFSNAAVALNGLGAIAVALGGMEAVVLAFGAIAQIPGIDTFMQSGGQLLADLCGIIGEMAGSIIGGIGEGISASLATIGDNISAFATSLEPAMTTFSGMNFAGLNDFAAAFGVFVLAMTGDAIASWFTGGIDYAKIGTDLTALVTNGAGFFDAVQAIPEAAFTNATKLFECLNGIGMLPNSGGVVGWFAGEVDYAGMALGLRQLATAAPAFTAIQDIPDAAFAKMTLLFEALAGIKGLPSEGGIFQWFAGDKSTAITSIAAALPGVATDIASFFTNLGDRTDFSPIKNLFETIGNINIDADAASKGFLGLGTSDFEKIGQGLSSFATEAATFFSAIDSYSATTISDFFAAIGEGGELPAKLEGLDGTIGTTLSNIATNVGTKMAEIKTKIETEINAMVATVNLKQTAFFNAGVHIMQGLNSGINSMRSTLMATARSIASSIQTTLNNAMQVHSPSRVTFETGQFVGQGLNLGMRSMIPDIQGTAVEVGNAAIPYGGTYTPEGSATYYSSGGNSEITTISPVFNLTVSGTQDDRATARRIKRYVAEAITETFESMERTGHLSLV